MSECRDYKEIILGESFNSNDSSPDWEPSGEPSGETLSSQDTWSVSIEDSSQDSFLVSSQEESYFFDFIPPFSLICFSIFLFSSSSSFSFLLTCFINASIRI